MRRRLAAALASSKLDDSSDDDFEYEQVDDGWLEAAAANLTLDWAPQLPEGALLPPPQPDVRAHSRGGEVGGGWSEAEACAPSASCAPSAADPSVPRSAPPKAGNGRAAPPGRGPTPGAGPRGVATDAVSAARESKVRAQKDALADEWHMKEGSSALAATMLKRQEKLRRLAKASEARKKLASDPMRRLDAIQRQRGLASITAGGGAAARSAHQLQNQQNQQPRRPAMPGMQAKGVVHLARAEVGLEPVGSAPSTANERHGEGRLQPLRLDSGGGFGAGRGHGAAEVDEVMDEELFPDSSPGAEPRYEPPPLLAFNSDGPPNARLSRSASSRARATAQKQQQQRGAPPLMAWSTSTPDHEPFG